MCVQPLTLKTGKTDIHSSVKFNIVPCGRCPECVKAKINSWLFRLDKELEISTTPLFITLTYNEECVPRTTSGRKTLRKRDIQLWLKRLRKEYAKISKKRIVYYLCGEYGSRTRRPHYHAVMLNMDNPELIPSTWKNGFTDYSILGKNGARYVLKYMSKQKLPKDSEIEREFSLMSKKIGANYLTDAMVKYHNRRVENCVIVTKKGYKMALPKYYKEKIYDEISRKNVTDYMQKRAKSVVDERVKKQMLKYPNESEKLVRKNLEISKFSKTFEKRNEVL